ncbi:hypothetical protein OG758_48370 [Streptomyces sp. NBC_01474]|uniref:hypothetical protein n=1 Tax=unclassified Streptomyces TaxID=2593676 RepID=UPI002DD7E5D4|nr:MULTISPECIES: hypothetical protein [unclassified Streptomyces]WSE01236.1 hypothetical protein OG758_48370 [Streptomyces sp. NBC_01474]
MQPTPPFESWALRWAICARGVPQGSLLAGFLVDLVVDARQVYLADTVCFPLNPAARALGVGPARLRSALQRLSEVGLLTWHADGAPGAPDVTVTLLFSSMNAATTGWEDGGVCLTSA